jgi:hypothetical protein
MENTIILHVTLPHISHQVQLRDLCVVGITKWTITWVNRTADGNIQSFHIVKLVSAFHPADNLTDVIASFRNVGIVLRLMPDGIPIVCVDIETG